MSDQRPPLELSSEDIRALRYLGIAWGAVIMAAWLVLEDDRTKLLTTAIDVAILAATLLALYLMRRWKSRR